MEKQRIAYLLNRMRVNNITHEEQQELSQLLREDKHQQLFSEAITEMMEQQKINPQFDHSTWHGMLENIVSIDKTEERKKTGRIIKFGASLRWVAAAVILFVISGAVYFTLFNHKNEYALTKLKEQPQQFKNDVKPGTTGGILTLADGSKIVLDSAGNGALAKQGNTEVVKHDGQLAYNTVAATSEILYNTMTTPIGRQYSLVLADGSKVWLNAASSIRFPTAFAGKERNVEITGEVYFEVAKNVAMPFKVKVNGMEIQVLGTHFNVNAYSNEASIKTTLMAGSVKLFSTITPHRATVLKPGQQGILSNSSGAIKVLDGADIEEALAWKNGLFRFNSTNIQTIMRQVGRWYDVDIEYKGDVSHLYFSGGVPMSKNVSELLKILELTKSVHFTIEEKKITVLP